MDQFVHAVDAVHTAADHVVIVGHALAESPLLDQFQITGHRVQRRLQFMGENTNELEADALLFLREFAGLFG